MMAKFNKTYLSLLVFLFLSCNIAQASLFETKEFSLGGYYKNIFTTSKTLDTKQGYYSDTNRLRLDAKYKPSDNLLFHFIYDNNMIFNDFSKTPDFDLIRQKNQKNLAFLDADRVISDKDHFYWEHLLYRGYVKYTSDKMHVTAGKQAIDWSRMRFYHTLDIFNPVSPLDIEKDEQVGVDALNTEFFPAGLPSINLLYVPYKNRSRNGWGVKISERIKDYDLGFIAAEYRKERTFGVYFDGNLKQAGFRGEITATRDDTQRDFARVNLGIDHNFNPKLYTVAEYFYNGGAQDNPEQFFSSFVYSEQVLSMFKNLLSVGAEYELTGITKIANYFIFDLEKGSGFYNPEIRCNATTNLDLCIGAQIFWGSQQSEFGDYQNLFYTQAKLYF
ncbi:MAG: hypothetical protein PHO70_07675 [Candidatus Omnitrophica bacterium]|nr:hypothetical protein [Candidatus Omnitrophota bacterium]